MILIYYIYIGFSTSLSVSTVPIAPEYAAIIEQVL